MKNSNQRSEEWRSAVSSQQSARERGRDREIAPTRRAVSSPSVSVRKRSRSGDRFYKEPSAVCGFGFMLTHLTAPVRLGMQIAFGRVRRKTAPTGPGEMGCQQFGGF